LREGGLPNFDVWYPLGISATLYSIMTIWLAVRRFVKRVRKMLGWPIKEKEAIISSVRQPVEVQIDLPFAVTSIQTLQMPESHVVSKNDL
jgi:hypothetical protein